VKRVVITFAVAMGVTVGGAMSAHAGEYDGKGDPIPGAHMASSACAFSGQDLPDEIENNPPGFDDDFVTDGRAQSYGMYVKAGLKEFVPSPGVACRGNLEFHE
jgi:hypothetical protein